MAKTLYAVYGASGFGREVLPILRNQLEFGSSQDELDVVFVDDNPQTVEKLKAQSTRILSFSEFLAEKADNKYASIAIADCNVREKISNKLANSKIIDFSVRSKSTEIFDNVSVGPGSILCSFVTLTSDITIGRYFHANIYSYVAHDCIIGDFVTFAPGVKCNGNVHIRDYAYIGTGAIIKQGTPEKPIVIGEGAVIGAGAVITKSVPAGEVWVGNPGRKMERS